MEKIDMSGKDNPFLKLPLEMPMTHRYKVYSEQNKNLEWLVKKVEVNYFKKRIVAKVYETANSDTHNWIEKSIGSQAEDKWTLVALSGLGEKLYTHIFDGLKIEDHSVRYDYVGQSEVVAHTVTFGFENFKKVNNVN